jgi:hypothetical protein
VAEIHKQGGPTGIDVQIIRLDNEVLVIRELDADGNLVRETWGGALQSIPKKGR